MRRAFALVAAILLAGCASRGELQVGSTLGSGPGTSINSTSAGLQVQGGSSNFATLLAIGVLAVMSYRSEIAHDGAYAVRMIPARALPAPELAPDRRVNEHDCTRPIEDWSTNLKCR